MKHILVNKSIAYAAKVGGGTITKNEINLLDTGAIAVFTEEGVLVTAANAATVLDDVKKFYMAVGNQAAASKSIITVPIPRTGTNYTKTEYLAPVQLVKFVGNDGTIGALNYPTLIARDEATLKIIDTTPGLRTIGSVSRQEIFRYGTSVRTGDTAAAITLRIIANINADPDRIVNAAGVNSNTGISLTAIGAGTTFSVALDGILINATVEQPEGTVGASVAMRFGKGTYDQVASLEDLYSVERGQTNRTHLAGLYYTANSLAVAGATYDIYTFTFNGSREISTGRQETYHFDILVAMPDAATQQANFETIMAEMFGGLVATSPAEIGV